MPNELSLRKALLKELEQQGIPRDIELAALLTLPVSILAVGRLSVSEVHRALLKRSISITCDVSDRPLRGCLVAYAGHGLIFVDGLDSQAQRRFTIAHECAHFLVDYLEPREAASDLLGINIIDVLNGRRIATTQERILGTLAGVSSRPHLHSMHRDPAVFTGIDEVHADRLAFEMLAPPHGILTESEVTRRWDKRKATAELLIRRYQFPGAAAQAYAALLHEYPDEEPVRSQFGF